MNNSHTSPHFLGANRIETTSEAFLIDQHSTTFFKTPLKIALRSISLHTVAKWQILFKNKGQIRYVISEFEFSSTTVKLKHFIVQN